MVTHIIPARVDSDPPANRFRHADPRVKRPGAGSGWHPRLFQAFPRHSRGWRAFARHDAVRQRFGGLV
jgi:hypothetical protein